MTLSHYSNLLCSSLTLEQCRTPGAMIMFTVMDHDMLTANDFAGEGFLSLGSIPGVNSTCNADNFHGLKHVDLPLMHQKNKSEFFILLLLILARHTIVIVNCFYYALLFTSTLSFRIIFSIRSLHLNRQGREEMNSPYFANLVLCSLGSFR